ncbi:968_t:CDS:2, partial [Cetraspora pellucida]
FSDQLAQQASCYGLPYGIFGIVCWTLSLCSISLAKVRIPLFSPWLWCESYKAQNPIMAIIVTALTVGPIIYTCIHCHEEWMIVLIALEQLTPWSLKFLYDAWYEEIELEDIEENRPRIIVYLYEHIGSFLGLLLSVSGWIGLIVITVKLIDLERVVGSHIILAMVSNNMSGIPPGIEMISAIIFFT